MNMSSTSSEEGHEAPDMTPEQQGVFFDFFKQKEIPSWLIQASSTKRESLHRCIVASQVSRANAINAMALLKPPHSFCAPLLTKAISDKVGEPLNIKGVVFQHVRSTSSLLGLRSKLILPIDRDLLEAACENFEDSETLADSDHEKSLIYQPEKINGRSNKVLPIEPHEFAQLCRTLDLGKQYQTHLNSIFEPYIDTGEVRKHCIAHSQRCFEVDMQIALMKKHVSEKVFLMLGDVLANKQSIKFDTHSIAYKRLELSGYALEGAMLIVAVSDGAYDDNPCVLYLPGDPDQPLKEYPSFRKMEVALSARLRSAAFTKVILRFISLKNRGGFDDMLKLQLLKPPTGLFQPSSSGFIPVTTKDVHTGLFAQLYRQRVDHVMANARLLVVPTDDEDEKSRAARLEKYKEIGFDIVFFAASFIPVVGELLTAVAAAQMLLEVYHGVESWSAGEQEQAADYFFDTVENIIVALAFSVGAVAVKAAYKKVRSSSFVDTLRQVRLSGDQERLWKPDLLPYRQHLALPHGLKADERGLHWINKQAYVSLDKDLYAVRPEPDTGLWEVQQLSNGDSYTPRLETNDRGAWRHDSELPQEWDRLTVFRRLGYSAQDISDVRALQILSVIDIDISLLRRTLIDRTNPPALLIDTVRRFAADQAVLQFIEQLGGAQTAPLADAELQLRLLMTLKRWPVETRIEVVDAEGRTVSTLMPADTTDGQTKALTLTMESLRKGQFYAPLLAGLEQAERESIVQSTTKISEEQAAALVQVLARQAGRKRLDLFDWLYQRGVPVREAQATPLRSHFPDLPISVIDELVHYADASEMAELDNGKVPLRLAEEARRFQQVVRINRAYEGLYLDAAGGIDTDRLVFNTLEHLPGWRGDIYIRLLEWSFYTEEFASIGPDDATQKLFMSAHPDRYEASNEQYDLRSYLPGRTREHYFQSLWDGLSPVRRSALGVQANDQEVALREKLTALALERRAQFAQVLEIRTMREGYTSPMRLADPQSQTSSSSASAQAAIPVGKPAAHVRRAQELYPTHSLEQIDAFLSSLGSSDVLVLRKLESMRMEFLTLREVLQSWINRDTRYQTSDGPRLKVSTLAKTRASREIIRCWRKETPATLSLDGMLYELSLPPLHLGDLPRVVGDFSHVGTLILDRIGASAGLNSFLHNFSRLRTLSLIGNELSRMPQAVGSMTRLESLSSSENRIQLTTASVNELSGLTRLKHLDLSANPTLSLTPNVAHMPQLESLKLRGTGISQWPQGATGLAKLKLLDLRDNGISQIPEDVYAAPLTLNAGTNVSGNPLDHETLRRVADFQQLSQISLGLIASGHLREAAEVILDVSMISTWLTGVAVEDEMQKRALWGSLFAYPNSRPFFTLLMRLRYTADFRVIYSSLRQRVWEVVQAASADDALRRALFLMADTQKISADGDSLLFSDLYVRMLCYRAINAARGGVDMLEGQVLVLLRSLFRLQEVEKYALRNILSRSRTGPLTSQQAMEISLAFRVGLAEHLNLLAQPREINTRLSVDVLQQTLEWVYAEIAKTEQTTALPDWMNAQEFWVDYLENTHRDAFDELALSAALAFQQLDGRLNYTREQFTESMNAIVDNYRNDRTALFKRLTIEALQRHPGLMLPNARG